MRHLLHIAPAATFLALVLAPGVVRAQNRRWSFGVELGAGTMLHDFDHTSLNLSTPALTVSPRFAFRIVGPLSVQFGATYGRFLRERRDIAIVGAMAGLRFERNIGRIMHLRADGDFGVFIPGMVARPGFDVGASLLFDLADFVTIGPYVRFTHVWEGREGFASPDIAYAAQPGQDTDSIHWWTIGLTVSLHPRPKAPSALPAATPAATPAPTLAPAPTPTQGSPR